MMETQRPLRADYLIFGSPRIEEDEINEVVDSLRSCWLGTGPKVALFERMFREYVGTQHSHALNSCTAGLHLSMLVAGVGPGDEVIVPDMTFAATANAVVHTGATPVFVDVEWPSSNINPAAVDAAVTERTKAIVPVHFAGRPCNMDAIMAIARKHGLRVIEDCAHAIESVYHGRKCGTIGDMGCFSFYATKNVTTGEGGMVTTDREDWARDLEIWGLHGLSRGAWQRYSDSGYKHYQVVAPGFKYNMMDLQAAIGIHQLRKVDDWAVRRREIWARYKEAFADLPLDLPAPEDPDTTHARHLFQVLLKLDEVDFTRDEFQERLHEMNIGTGIHYIGLHLHPYYQERFGFRPEDFPVSRMISDRTLSLPLSAKLTEGDVEDVVSAVRIAVLS
ncbi:MAG TPA: DegT/DnrJ/EryC1/StrS family aminotransferase [Armatimonadota bacterium]|jgi:dTDP-4-amino-4,6-dideoxygalactose transaminase